MQLPSDTAPSLHPHQIDLLHQPSCLHERDDDLLVVQDVLIAQLAVFAVLEPFLAGLGIKMP